MMHLIPGADASASALNAEKLRMDIIAQNIANANTTRDVDGEPYKRKLVMFETLLERTERGREVQGVRVSGLMDDPTPGDAIYNPAHPHADENGMVHMPNVKVSREMVDLISTSRAYEANLSVVKTSRQMAAQALSIGR